MADGMKMKKDKAYFEDGASWERDRVDSERAKARLAFGLAIMLGLCLAAALGVIAIMAPLKERVPYVVEVDSTTGVVSVKTTLAEMANKSESLRQDEALTSSFLVRYVVARETFQKTDIEAQYERVRIFTEPRTFAPYDAMFKDEARSPYRLFPRGRLIEIKSVGFLNNQTAQVRFISRNIKEVGEDVGHYIAIIGFRYVEDPLNLKDRWENPLGFQVTSYRVDQETAP